MTVRRKQLHYLGKVFQMGEDRLTRQMWNWTRPDARWRRPRGRPRKRLQECVSDTLHKCEIKLEVRTRSDRPIKGYSGERDATLEDIQNWAKDKDAYGAWVKRI
jgi:bifunctional pyridoxal-dependent enzyme with beta-cystathionase and maltose regulon repressor activities